jgi:uncharacterized protein YecT (DUF1311 family)
MASRDRIAEITEKKRRGPKRSSRFEAEFQRLRNLWQKMAPSTSETDDFFVIRAVALLEALSRDYLARLINSGAPYAENVVELKLELKFDLRLVRAIETRVITLGDLIADAVPISSFGHICGPFSKIIGEDLVPLLSLAKARPIPWMARYGQPETGKIIADPKNMTKALSRLFEVRHILCHEFPQGEVYERKEIDVFLAATGRFAAALTVTLEQLMYGDVPDTIEGQIEVAQRELEEEEKLMAEVYARVEGPADRKNLRLLTKAQRAWDVFREAQAAYRADGARGGTASKLLWLSEADRLTRQRIESLRCSLSDDEEE